MDLPTILKIAAPVAMMIWGFIVKYHPKFAKVVNDLIPYMNTAIGWLISVGVPLLVPAAHADVNMQPAFIAIGLGGFFSGVGHFLLPVLSSAWQAAQVSLLYKVFGEHAVEQGLGWQPNSAPTPAPPVRA